MLVSRGGGRVAPEAQHQPSPALPRHLVETVNTASGSVYTLGNTAALVFPSRPSAGLRDTVEYSVCVW